MKLFLALVLAVAAFGQDKPLPTYVWAGVLYNQTGSPKWNASLGAIYPAIQSIKLYTSTAADIVPVKLVDAKTGKPYWGFAATVSQGAHRLLGTWGKFSVFLGGDLGAGLTQEQVAGLNISLAGSFTATPVYEFSSHWAVGLPLRGAYIGETKTWYVIPELCVFFKP